MNPFVFFYINLSNITTTWKLNFFRRSIHWLKLRYDKLDIKSAEDLPFNSLSPINDADIGNDYQKALEWALRNRKEKSIKNIALTGPYGSGKSSILETFIRNLSGLEYRFLKISLATFQDEIKGKAKDPTQLMRLIELSILQQIFYRETDEKIPDSRFKRIKSINKQGLIVITSWVILFILAIINLAFPGLAETISDTTFSDLTISLLRYASVLLVLVGSFILIFKSIRTIQGITVDKLNIHNAEIKIKENVEKSILNHHLDEILYFFEAAKYNVVIIEDLDRFQQTEIFTKLREINMLINNSEKIKDDVVFIYAVRDEIFTGNNERTKFFDFIIPVIPVINPSNSGEKMLEKKLKYEFKINDNLIENISLFIDDMRLVHNIFNEYYLYSQKLNAGLDQDKLLSIIVYKNLFPVDFVKLTNNDGLLYAALKSKESHIQSISTELDNRIANLSSEVGRLQEVALKDVGDLRYIYLLYYVAGLRHFISFRIDGEDRTLVDMIQDENFDRLINGTAQVFYYDPSYGQRQKDITTSFASIEKTIGHKHSYSERLSEIQSFHNGKLNQLKREISDLHHEKSHVRSKRIAELLEQGDIKVNIGEGKQQQILNVLLRNQFIDEEYLDYVSIFYEGTISKTDHQFLVNVKTRAQTDYNYKLDKIPNLIKKIGLTEFGKEFVLNFSLLDFLLTSQDYKEFLDKTSNKLADGSNTSFRFIDAYFDKTIARDKFIRLMADRWPGFWYKVEKHPTLTDERKAQYFEMIIKYADISSLPALQNFKAFKERMESTSNILSILGENHRTKDLFPSLQLKLQNVDLNSSPSELIDYIFESNYFALNPYMIQASLQHQGRFNISDFERKNFSSILQANGSLLQYVEDNINDYVQNTFLLLPNNKFEDIASLVHLLNHQELTTANKEAIIKHVDTRIDDLSTVEDNAIQKILLKESKVSPKWENIIEEYHNNEASISQELVHFLNNKENALELGKTNIPAEVQESDETDAIVLKKFTSDLVFADELKDESFKLLMSSLPEALEDVQIAELSQAKVQVLILAKKLKFSPQMFKSIREEFANLLALFVEMNFEVFIEEISECELTEDDVQSILASTKFSINQKQELIDNVSDDLLDTNQVKTVIGHLLLYHRDLGVSNRILNGVLTLSKFSAEERIAIFNSKQAVIENDFVDTFLVNLPEPYSEIANRGKRPWIPNNQFTRELVAFLKQNGHISSYEFDNDRIRINTFRKD